MVSNVDDGVHELVNYKTVGGINVLSFHDQSSPYTTWMNKVYSNYMTFCSV